MTENEIAKVAVECALKVHSTLGPGLLESAYEECLFFELKYRSTLGAYFVRSVVKT
ncbi:MAG: GxxExxY protein [Bacteroidetes bacterium]|nr:GxxExxY protein [Bacteroidota bacterium]